MGHLIDSNTATLNAHEIEQDELDKKLPAHCETVQERFDNDDWLGDALAENLDLVRNIRNFIPDKGERVERASELSGCSQKVIASQAINLINALEDYMEEE